MSELRVSSSKPLHPDGSEIDTYHDTSGQLWATCSRCNFTKIKLPASGNTRKYLDHWKSCLSALVNPVIPTRPSQLVISEVAQTPPHDLLGKTTPVVNHPEHNSAFRRFNEELDPIAPLFVAPNQHPCPGFVIRLERALERYPMGRHVSENLGWVPVSFSADGRDIIVKSTKCTGARVKGQACDVCTNVCNSKRLEDVLERIRHVSPNTPYQYLTFEQAVSMLHKSADECTQLRTQISNLKQSIRHMRSRVTWHKRVEDLLSTQDFPSLRRILHRLVKKRRMSPERLHSTLVECLRGGYHPRGNWSQLDLDLAFLVKVRSGRRLRETLRKAQGVASTKALSKHYSIPNLLVSVSRPTLEELSSNISAFFDSEILLAPTPVGVWQNRRHVGVTLMWDGIAIEQHCQWCHIRDVPLGFCREHSQHWSEDELKVTDYSSLKMMKCAAEDSDPPKKLCYAKEATVAAIAPIAPLPPTGVYHAIPIMVSPSCKSETADELLETLKTIITAWKEHPDGECKHGPIRILASDGDGASRAAKITYCRTHHLKDVDSKLHNRLCNLPGLDLFCSEDGCVPTCDFKHIWKRFCTLIRGPEGLVVFGTHLCPQDWQDALVTLGHTEAEAQELFDYKDKQNVPKTTALLLEIKRLDHLPDSADQRDRNIRTAICFMAEMLSCFLLPFIDCDMGLPEQIESLVTFAHLAAAVQIEQGTSCLTGEVYSDSQSAVKSIVFTIANMQLVDGELKFYIILDGMDRLEVVFSGARTQDHARNMDSLQLGQKLGTAAAEEAVYARNPGLDPGHKRLKTQKLHDRIQGKKAIDHERPRNWPDAIVRVGDVFWEERWMSAHQRYEKIVLSHYPHHKVLNLREYFSGERKSWSFSRPRGQWVGVRADINSKKSERPEETALDSHDESDAYSTDSELSDDESETGSTADSASNEEAFMNDTHSQENDSGTKSLQMPPTALLPLLTTNTMYELPFAPAQAFEVTPPTSSQPSDLLTRKEHTARRAIPLTNIMRKVEIEGKLVPKTSAVPRMLSTPYKQSADRFRRVQGETRFGTSSKSVSAASGSKTTRLESTQSSIDNECTLNKRDFVATLVRSPNGVALVVFQVLRMVHGPTRTKANSLSWDLVDTDKSDVGVIGEAIKLCIGLDSANERWEWTGENLRKDTSPSRSVAGARKNYVFEVGGRLVVPLCQTIVDGIHGWTRKDLMVAMDDLWEIVNPPGTEGMLGNLDLLPDFSKSEDVPYSDSAGNHICDIVDIPLHRLSSSSPRNSAKLKANDEIECKLCDAKVKLKGMRAHVAEHILRCFRETGGTTTLNQTIRDSIGLDPCGFCGLNSPDTGCMTQLTYSKKGNAVLKSTCDYFYHALATKFEEKKVFSTGNKCTNTPMHCPAEFCQPNLNGEPRTVWSYNYMTHIIWYHSPRGVMPELPRQAWIDSFISREEEKIMGVSHEDTQRFRDSYVDLSSDDIVRWQQELHEDVKGEAVSSGIRDSEEVQVQSREVVKRQRASTKSVVSPKAKKKR